MNRELGELARDIAAGRTPLGDDLVPHLCAESTADRCRANLALAEALQAAGRSVAARPFVARAWLLSGFAESVLPLYIAVHAALGDLDAVRAAYTRLGARHAEAGHTAAAIGAFERGMYAYIEHARLDRYSYDFEALAHIERLAARHLGSLPQAPPARAAGGLRVAHLVFGATHISSVIVRIAANFARHHDRARCEPAFFVPDGAQAITTSAEGCKNLGSLAHADAPVIVSPEGDEERRLVDVAARVRGWGADVLLCHALLADPRQYFVASLRPAPLVVGLIAGPPPQFAAPLLDWCISWTPHPLMDCPCPGTLVDLEVDLPDPAPIRPDRVRLGVASDAVVVLSGGRHHKFQDADFWRELHALLLRNPEIVYVVLGAERSQLPVCAALPSELSHRLRVIPWTADYLPLLAAADVVVDTFPSGGGVVLMDAMALGIPAISFTNDYARAFDQTEWSPGMDIIPVPELVIERRNWDAFHQQMDRLIANGTLRQTLGIRCQDGVRATRGDPARMVRRCEDVLLRIWAEQLRGTLPTHRVPYEPLTSGRVGWWRRLASRARRFLRGR